MPQLSDLVEKRKFVKKEYRPWNLSGTGTIDNKENSSSEIIPISKMQANDLSHNTERTQEVNENTVSAHSHQSTNPLTDNKQVTTSNISGNETDNERITNKKQTDNKQETNFSGTSNKQVTNRQQTGNVSGNVSGNTETIFQVIESIKKLFGIQKNIFLHIVNLCSARGELNTGNILSSDLANASNCSIGSAKTSLIRLIEKNLVFRLQGRACRGGYMILGITEQIQAALIQTQMYLATSSKQLKTDNIMGNVTGNMNLYSSSNKNITTTTIPEDWKKIDFELLNHIGFTETQLRQLYSSNLTTPEIIQESINHFAFGLEHTEKVKNYPDPLNVFMGVLRKGQIWREPAYISPKELALQQLLEEKQKQKERYDARVKELIDLDFPQWRKNLMEEEIKKIVSPAALKTKLAPAITAELRTYFIENVLSKKLEKKL